MPRPCLTCTRAPIFGRVFEKHWSHIGPWLGKKREWRLACSDLFGTFVCGACLLQLASMYKISQLSMVASGLWKLRSDPKIQSVRKKLPTDFSFSKLISSKVTNIDTDLLFQIDLVTVTYAYPFPRPLD